MTKVIVLPGLTLNQVTDDDLDRIRTSGGADTEVVVCNFTESPDQTKQEAADADVILGIVPPELFAAAPKVKWVQSISSGVDSFMYPEFINNPVVLTSEKGLVGEHLADHGFGLLLMLTRQLASARDLGPAAWHHRPALRAQELELTGATMVIIGLGGTGRAMARRALAFGMNVVALDRDAVAPMDDVVLHVGADHLPNILALADVVSVCCPLTSETDKLINASNIAQMKAGAFLINVTRGEVVDEDDVVAALKSGHLRGAGLDVAPREPLPADSELWRLSNVVMTPHTAGASQFRAGRNMDRFIENLAKFVNNEPLEGIIDKTLGY
ncbi:MAG: D-2-hydroxyacid dehydrogenase [Pseudomonadales bacterium]|nr:D-2-hydroxyacid dehydrogenase [Pseudomonadales bacterium]